jgi:hypothetical protein
LDEQTPCLQVKRTAKVPKEEAVANSGKGLDLFQRELRHDRIRIVQVSGCLGWGANPILARVGIATAFSNPIARSRTQSKDGTRHALNNAKTYNEKGFYEWPVQKDTSDTNKHGISTYRSVRSLHGLGGIDGRARLIRTHVRVGALGVLARQARKSRQVVIEAIEPHGYTIC